MGNIKRGAVLGGFVLLTLACGTTESASVSDDAQGITDTTVTTDAGVQTDTAVPQDVTTPKDSATQQDTGTVQDITASEDAATVQDSAVPQDTGTVDDTATVMDTQTPDVQDSSDTPSLKDTATVSDTKPMTDTSMSPETSTGQDTAAPEDAAPEDTVTPQDTAVVLPDAGVEVDAGGGGQCGDGVLTLPEMCDDGNLDNNDGCALDCTIEPQCTAGCTSKTDCPMGEQCVGHPKSIDQATGQCEDTKTQPMGLGKSCGATMPCGPGLACLGEFLWKDGQGFCVAQWMAKDFYSADNVAIPDAGGNKVVSPVVACGLATVPVDIVVTLHLDHPRPQDLVVVLEDPNGQQGTILNNQPYTGGPIVAKVGSGDDSVNGQWSLHVVDTVAGETGTLLGWSVYLLSNWD